MEQLKCLRCGVEMEFVGREKIQLGRTGWILGDLPNLVAGALETAIFTCPKCGKLEFFQGDLFDDEGEEAGSIAKTRCPSCGVSYDLDYPKCPRCGEANRSEERRVGKEC